MQRVDLEEIRTMGAVEEREGAYLQRLPQSITSSRAQNQKFKKSAMGRGCACLKGTQVGKGRDLGMDRID